MRLKDDEENAAAVALGLMKFLNVAADERTNNLRMKTGVYQNKNETTSQIVVVFRCSNCCCCFSYTTKIWHYSFHKQAAFAVVVVAFSGVVDVAKPVFFGFVLISWIVVLVVVLVWR